MAAETKASVAARFANGAYVSAEDFATLVSSYQDFSDVLFSIATAAQNGSIGMVYISGSSTVTLYSAAAQGLRLLNTATTAAAQQQLGGGTVGRVVFEAITTASSQQQLGGGTVGRTLFETTTTVAAQAIIGSVSAATQAEMEAATANGVVATPNNLRWHPGVAKAHALVEVTAGVGTQILRAGYGIATVSIMSTGNFRVTFTTAFSGQYYSPLAIPFHNAAFFTARVSAASFPLTENAASAAAFTISWYDSGGGHANPIAFSLVVFGDT